MKSPKNFHRAVSSPRLLDYFGVILQSARCWGSCNGSYPQADPSREVQSVAEEGPVAEEVVEDTPLELEHGEMRFPWAPEDCRMTLKPHYLENEHLQPFPESQQVVLPHSGLGACAAVLPFHNRRNFYR